MSINILALESSCDETAAAVVADGSRVLSNVVFSQVKDHMKFGGVVPEVASRRHLEVINPVLEEALSRSNLDVHDLAAVSVTHGPGLVGALLVGVATAKAAAFALKLPLIGVNHLEGHIYANFLCEPGLSFPLVTLIVSGGHTDLVYMAGHGRYRVVGRTRDDAAGEAFDKVARVLGLGYPGGPLIDRLAQEGDPEAVVLPRAYLEPGSLDFSFSGLKTAVFNRLAGGAGARDLASGFQRAVVDVLVDKTIAAARKMNVKTVLLAGGVAANRLLREELKKRVLGEGLRFACPPPDLCTDNAAMIGCAAYYRFLRGEIAQLSLSVEASLPLAGNITDVC